MRAAIIAGGSQKVSVLAKAVARGLEKAGYQVEILEAVAQQTPKSMAPYDLVCVGSPVLGAIGGRIAPEVAEFVARCTRLEGKRAAAFVPIAPLGTAKSIRALMGELEKQGAHVVDFQALKGESEAEVFGLRLRPGELS
ncbi:MAG: flavodoxin family protein [Syntrophothermus sp.]